MSEKMKAIAVNKDGTYKDVTDLNKKQREELKLDVLEFGVETTDAELKEYARQWSKGCLVL